MFETKKIPMRKGVDRLPIDFSLQISTVITSLMLMYTQKKIKFLVLWVVLSTIKPIFSYLLTYLLKVKRILRSQDAQLL